MIPLGANRSGRAGFLPGLFIYSNKKQINFLKPPMSKNRSILLFTMIALFSAFAVSWAGSLRINEFMASNAGSLLDEDGSLGANWIVLQANVPGSNGTTTVTDPATNTMRFYRVRVP